MIISRKRPSNPNSSLHPACVYVNGSPLEVLVCGSLTIYHGHFALNLLCSRARTLLSFMYRCDSHCDSDTILMLYKPQVLPILDYACVLWDPHLKKDNWSLFNTLHLKLLIDPGMPRATMHFASSTVFLP